MAKEEMRVSNLKLQTGFLPTGFMFNNRPTICGGIITSDQSLCYQLHGQEWKKTSFQMPRNASSLSSVTFDNGSVWLLGGNGPQESDNVANTSLLYPNGSINKGPDLPRTMAKFCSVAIDEFQVLIVDCEKKDVYVFDSQMGSFWTRMEDLPVGKRENCQCALAKNYGNPLVIVDGWFLNVGTPSLVFNVKTRKWTKARDNSKFLSLYASGMFSYGEGVISVGGTDLDNQGKTFIRGQNYYFEPKLNDWQPFGQPYDDHDFMGDIMIAAPASYVACSS